MTSPGGIVFLIAFVAVLILATYALIYGIRQARNYKNARSAAFTSLSRVLLAETSVDEARNIVIAAQELINQQKIIIAEKTLEISELKNRLAELESPGDSA